MKNSGKTLILAATSVALVLAAHAAVKTTPGEGESSTDGLSSDNPYGAIINRNIFDLHDAPTNDTSTNKPPQPPANVKLTGITTILGNKQALFVMTEQAPGKPASTRYLTLVEGQRSGAVEVLAINPKARSATIKNDGTEFTLNIETNKSAGGGGPPPVAGGIPGARATGYPPGGKVPGGYPRGESLPARPMRSEPEPGTTFQPTPVSQPSAVPQPNYGYGGATVNPQQSVPPAQQQQLTAQEQWTLMEVQRAQAQSGAADPNLALLLPPTPLSPGANQQQAPSSSEPPSPGSAPPAPGTRVSGGFRLPQ